MATDKVASGTPSEIAMLKYADEMVEVVDLRKKYEVLSRPLLAICIHSLLYFVHKRVVQMVFEIPFNSKRKYHLMIARSKDNGDGQATYKLLIKGASDILVKMCSTIMTVNGNEDFSGENMERFEVCFWFRTTQVSQQFRA